MKKLNFEISWTKLAFVGNIEIEVPDDFEDLPEREQLQIIEAAGYGEVPSDDYYGPDDIHAFDYSEV